MTATSADVTAMCERIQSLAADLDITLSFIGDAGPEYNTPDAVLVEFGSRDDSDLIALQEVTYLGPYEFGCDWEWHGPEGFTYELKVLLGRPCQFRRAIPRADLATLIECLMKAKDAATAVDTRRLRWHLVAFTTAFLLFAGDSLTFLLRGHDGWGCACAAAAIYALHRAGVVTNRIALARRLKAQAVASC